MMPDDDDDDFDRILQADAADEHDFDSIIWSQVQGGKFG
jgi:hypothetical protein